MLQLLKRLDEGPFDGDVQTVPSLADLLQGSAHSGQSITWEEVERNDISNRRRSSSVPVVLLNRTPLPNSDATPSSWPYDDMQSPRMPSVCGYAAVLACPRILDTVLSMLSLALWAAETPRRSASTQNTRRAERPAGSVVLHFCSSGCTFYY